jgi:hypothetical protein
MIFYPSIFSVLSLRAWVVVFWKRVGFFFCTQSELIYALQR